MTNPFSSRSVSLSGPGVDYAPVNPSDSADLKDVAIALYAETGGVIRFVSVKGETRSVAVPDFGWVLCGVKAVLSSGTTAGGIHAVTIN